MLEGNIEQQQQKEKKNDSVCKTAHNFIFPPPFHVKMLCSILFNEHLSYIKEINVKLNIENDDYLISNFIFIDNMEVMN